MRDTLKLFDGIRSKVGFDVELCHDVHERLKPIEAIKFACELERSSCSSSKTRSAGRGQWMRQLREKTRIPWRRASCSTTRMNGSFLITEQLIDFIRVHISQIGGITPARKLQIFAEQFGVKTAWHGPGDMSPIAHAANIHIDLAARNFGVQEWSGTEPPNFVIQDLKGPREPCSSVFPACPSSGRPRLRQRQAGPGRRYRRSTRPRNIPAKTPSPRGRRHA
jgi:mannonate dehydratase